MPFYSLTIWVSVCRWPHDIYVFSIWDQPSFSWGNFDMRSWLSCLFQVWMCRSGAVGRSVFRM